MHLKERKNIMSCVITIANAKGGIAKTTSSLALASICASLGKKTLLVDMDPQCNSSKSMGIMNHSENGYNTLRLFQLQRESSLTEEEYLAFITATEFNNLYGLPCDSDMFEYMEELLLDKKREDPNLILEKAITIYKEYFDFIFIDTTPFYCLLTRIAIIPSNYIIAPIKADGYSIDGLSNFLDRIQGIKMKYKIDSIFKGFFLTCANTRTNLFKSIYETFGNEMSDNFLCSYIRTDNKINESTTKDTLSSLFKAKKAIHDYKKLLIELDILSDKDSKKILREIRKEEKEEKIKESGKDK